MEKSIEEMNIIEKITALTQSLAKSQNIDYAIQVAWGIDVDRDQEITRMKTLIENAKILFVQGSIDKLEMDVRNEAYANWNNIFDDELKKFPEYSQTKSESVPKM